jgi:hypothetical protein
MREEIPDLKTDEHLLTYGSFWTTRRPGRKSKFVLHAQGKTRHGKYPGTTANTESDVTPPGARRISLPVDIELTFNNLTILAVIRDVSFSNEPDSPDIGVGLFHNAPLPLEEILKCRTNSHTDVLPAESTVVLMWTRDFGSDGYLSGGSMQQCVPESEDNSKPSLHCVQNNGQNAIPESQPVIKDRLTALAEQIERRLQTSHLDGR